MTESTTQPAAEIREDRFSLACGDVVLRWPVGMRRSDCEEIEEWFALMVDKFKRSTGIIIPPSERPPIHHTA